MKREKLIFVVVVMVCSFVVGTAFAAYELQKPNWCVVDCGFSVTMTTGTCRLDSSLGPLARHDEWMVGDDIYIAESGFYQINYSSWVANPTFVFNDTEISSTTIRFKLNTGSNPDWTQYRIAYSTAVNPSGPSGLFTGTTYYIKNGSIDWNPASFYEGVELTGLQRNTIYGFKIKSRIPPPEQGVSTDWSGNTDNYTWTHIETPGINVDVDDIYITSATVTAVGSFSNLGAGSSGINFGRDGSYAGWTTATSHTFTGLTSNTLYTFQVQARNGRSYETAVVSTSEYTLCGPPEDPYIVDVTSYSLTLGWSHSSLGAPEYYRIKENEIVIQDNWTSLSLDRDNLEYVNFKYTYKIYAVNKANETDETDGISSIAISTYTFCSIPPAPQIFAVFVDSATITINPGNNPWYTDFSIRVSGGGTDNFVQDDHKIGSSEWFYEITDWGNPLTISTLLSNVEYDISVQAKNEYGHLTGYGVSVSSCTYATVPGLDVEENKVGGWVRIYIQEGNNSPETEYAIWVEEKGVSFWENKGYLQDNLTTDLLNPVWQRKADWEEGNGFIEIIGLDLENYGYRFRAQARRTITGYSKKETIWSLYAYAGKVVKTPTAAIGLTKLNANETVYYKTDSTVTFTCSGADIRYTYTDDELTPDDPTDSSTLGTSLVLTAPQDQSITYKIKAKAWQGGVESDVGGVWIVVIDKDPPKDVSLVINNDGDDKTTLQKITLSIFATGADYMWIDGDVLDDSNTKQWIGCSTSRIVSLTGSEGDKTVTLRVKDKAENVTPPVSDPPVSDTITYDPHPPDIIKFQIDKAGCYKDLQGNYYTGAPENIYLIIQADYAVSMLIEGDVIKEEGVTKGWINYSDSAKVNLTAGDGRKTVTLTVANAIGTPSDTESDTITLDTTRPQNPTLILSDPDSGNENYTNNTNPTVTVINKDTDVVEFILSENITYSTQPDKSDLAWQPVPIWFTFPLSSGEGQKTVYLWVKDIVDHINAGVVSGTIALDTKPPLLGNPALKIDGGDYANSPYVTLQISATGAYEMWIDSDVIKEVGVTKEWISYSTSTMVTLTSGDVSKTVTIKFRDEAGNETSEESCTIILETTPPAIQGNIEARFVKHDTPLQEATETGCQTPTFIWKATDTYSGIGGYRYSFSPDVTVQPTIEITKDSVLLPLTTSYADGTYYFKVKAMDNAHNFSEVKSFAYKYKADLASPEATIQVEGKERVGDEVKGVKANAIPEIEFTEEVWGANQYVQVEVTRDNEGKEYKDRIVTCKISSTTVLLWKIDPGKDWSGNYTYRITAKDGLEDNAGNSLKEEKKLIFTTMLDRTKRNVVMWESDKTKLILEANALKEDGYVSINLEPLPLKGTAVREAKEVNKEAIIEADEKIKRSGDRYCYNLRESMRETSGYNTEGGKMVLGKFLNTVYLELPYGDANNDGIVDSTEGTSAPVREQTLSIYWLDEEHKLWVKVSGTKVDSKNNVASARIMGFGTYTLMGGGFYDLTDAYAYPVPYKPNDGLSTTGDETSGITFTNLSTEAEIKIYTISGELVKKLIHKDGWDEEWYPVENEKGEKVVSGVYIYYITNQKQHKSGKLVIIR